MVWLAASISAAQIEKMSLEQHIQQVIGLDSIDCGTIPRGPVSEATLRQSLACARDAVSRKKVFRLVQWLQGIDSEVATGLFVDREGSILFFYWDSQPCGGPGCAERFATNACRLADVEFFPFAPGYLTLRCR